MAEDNGYAPWGRGWDAGEYAEWSKWRKSISADVAAIRRDQEERAQRRRIIVGFFVVSGNIFKWIIGIAGAGALVWQAWVTLVQSAGNG